jgi:hypothetical protein
MSYQTTAILRLSIPFVVSVVRKTNLIQKCSTTVICPAPEWTDVVWPHVVHVFFHHTNIYSIRWLHLSSPIPSPLFVSSISPSWSLWLSSSSRIHMLAARGCSPSRGCSSAVGRSPGVLQGVLVEQAAVLASCSSRRWLPSAMPQLGHRRRCLWWGTSEFHAPPLTSASASSSATMSLHSSKQQGDIALESACCKHMFQVL